MKNAKAGFTLIELVVVIGILLTLFSITLISLTTGQRNVSIQSDRNKLISDIKIQQTKAMRGTGGGSNAFGIYFQPSQYTLFVGDSYSQSDPDNFVVSLIQGVIFSGITFPGATIIFATRSGEIDGFLLGNNTVTIEDSEGVETSTVTLNKYGVVSNVN